MEYWKGKNEFKQRVRFYADKIGIEIHSLTLRPMRKKWASCSSNGNLNFNVELLSLDQEIGEYVIVHELLHFHIANHGRLWKSLMVAYLGDYQQVEMRLKKRNNLTLPRP